jgi:imidazolonepropionase-like amidohydrolase
MRRAALILFVASAVAWAADDAGFVIEHATIHPVTAPDIPDGSVWVRGGKIAAVGAHVNARGARRIDGRGLDVYPGMIDSATDLGLREIASVRETNDTNELGEFDPQLQALVAVNPASEHIPVTRVNGITSAITLPATETGEEIIAGQAALVHLSGWTWEQMEVLREAAMEMIFPTLRAPRRPFYAAPAGPTPFREIQRAYEEKIRRLKDFFEQARRYATAKNAHAAGLERDLRYEAMIPVLAGKTPVLMVAQREREMKAALEFAREEKIRMILAGCRELGKLGPAIRAAGASVILGPTLAMPLEEDMPYDQAYTLPDEFYKAGILFAFGTFPGEVEHQPRNLPYQASMAAAFGLPKDEALRAVTINAAKIWGVADMLGSIETGKVADLILTDGDPLETRTNVKKVFIAGKEVDMTTRQTELYEMYRKRP